MGHGNVVTRDITLRVTSPLGALPGNPPSSPLQAWGGGAVPFRWLSPLLGWDVGGTGMVPLLLVAGR